MEKGKKTVNQLESEVNAHNIKLVQQDALLNYIRAESERLNEQIVQVKSNIAFLNKQKNDAKAEIEALKKTAKPQTTPTEEKQ